MASKKASAPALPKMKQCNTTGHEQFGSVAVWSELRGEWGVMNPGVMNPNALGGHWAADADVTDWDDATGPAPKDLPAPDPAPVNPPAPEGN